MIRYRLQVTPFGLTPVLAILCAIVGCSGTLGPRASAEGRYVLRTVNDHGLPSGLLGSVCCGSTSALEGSLTLHADGTYVDSLFIHNYKPYVVDRYSYAVRTGTWDLAVNVVTFSDNRGYIMRGADLMGDYAQGDEVWAGNTMLYTRE